MPSSDNLTTPTLSLIPSVDYVIVTPLIMVPILSLLDTALQHAHICSAGSRGYHSIKELILNGTPGRCLLIENVDLRSVGTNHLPGDNTITECPITSAIGSEDSTTDGTTEENISDEVSQDSTDDTFGEDHCCLIYTFGNPLGISFRDHINGVSHLQLLTNSTEIPCNFLFYTSLTSLDLSPVSEVTSIGDDFMRGCENLTTLVFGPLSKINSIGASFMRGCSSMVSLDVSPLSNISEIPCNFLKGCSSLTALDLSPLSEVTSVGRYFMAYCTSLVSLDVSPLSNITEIPKGFLKGCTSLTSIDLSPLCNVGKLPEGFLEGCTSLTTIDLSGLVKVTKLPLGFACGCTSLKTVILPPLLSQKTPTELLMIGMEEAYDMTKRYRWSLIDEEDRKRGWYFDSEDD